MTVCEIYLLLLLVFSSYVSTLKCYRVNLLSYMNLRGCLLDWTEEFLVQFFLTSYLVYWSPNLSNHVQIIILLKCADFDWCWSVCDLIWELWSQLEDWPCFCSRVPSPLTFINFVFNIFLAHGHNSFIFAESGPWGKFPNNHCK